MKKVPTVPRLSYHPAIEGNSIGVDGLKKHARSATHLLSASEAIIKYVLLDKLTPLSVSLWAGCWQALGLIINVDTLMKMKCGSVFLISRVFIHMCSFLNCSFMLFRKGKNPEVKEDSVDTFCLQNSNILSAGLFRIMTGCP